MLTNLVPIADTSLRNAAADVSFGTFNSLPVGVAASGNLFNHGLIKFPIEFIPTNAIVTEVSLQLASTVSNPNTQSTANYELFRLLKDWNEAATTWNTRLSPNVSWGIPGGQAGTDYSNTPSGVAPLAPATASGPSLSVFTSTGMLNDVELWRASTGTNFGWILLAQNNLAGSGKQIGSREDSLNSPVLAVTYTLPAPPPLIYDASQDGNQLRFSFLATAAQAYSVEFRTNLTTGNWESFLNIPAPLVDTAVHVTNHIVGDQRFFRIRLDAETFPTETQKRQLIPPCSR